MAVEAKDIFEATSRSLRDLLSENGLGLYIPPYQRPYGWDRGKVEKLLDDTLHGLCMLTNSADSFTFLGTIITIHDINYLTVQPIVRDEVPAKVLTVIDGQQRLCTLLLLSVCLHNQIRLKHRQVFKAGQSDGDDVALSWVNDQVLNLIKGLGATIYERQASGTSPLYPRIIRAFADQWSKKVPHARYESPIAYLISSYAEIAETKMPTEFLPLAREDVSEGERDLVGRYNEIARALRDLSRNKPHRDLENIPSLDNIAASKQFQKALLNHDFPDEVLALMTKNTLDPALGELLRLLMIGAYTLHRIALTVVKGKNENYAFTIFESLNTTGEPLTAFETFKPRVVYAEGLGEYGRSNSRSYVDKISDYLSGFRVGNQLQNATRDLLVSFALAETGDKLAKRLADQRSYLKEEYERHDGDSEARVRFVRHLSDTSSFLRYAWSPADDQPPVLADLPVNATTDAVRLCILFLKQLGHSVVIPPLVRFYEAALHADSAERAAKILHIDEAIRAITAFSVLWRASRRGTANIDSEYRAIMAGGGSLTDLGPLARTLRRKADVNSKTPTIDVAGLRQELVARLAHRDHGEVVDREDWINRSRLLPAYDNNQVLSRFLLLAAYHDTVEDPNSPGLITKGKEASGECLTFAGLKDEIHLTLEHVAPQSQNDAWPAALYTNKEEIHRLGNLVLLPQKANSSVSGRPWKEKRALYAALGARSKEEAKEILDRAVERGMILSDSTESLVELSKHMPHLSSLGRRDDEWNAEFIEARSRQLLELAWDRLWPWLVPDSS